MKDDIDPYLWDKSGEPTPDVVRLEQLLGRYRHSAPEPRGRVLPFVVGAAAIAALVLAVWWPFGSEPAGYRVEGVDGLTVAAAGTRIEVGARPARLAIADIGDVEVQPESVLRVEDGGEGVHALYLERGSLRARIDAEPRVFQVGSPAGLTIDLGCEYELAVTPEGRVRLTVHAGQVVIAQNEREVYVPAGASTESDPLSGPSPPFFDDVRVTVRDDVEAVLYGEMVDPEALARLAAFDDRDDALPLFAMLFDQSLDAGLREALYGRFEVVFEVPDGVNRESVLACDAVAREAWLENLRPWWTRQPSD
ncbi:MAG: hypothetical protein GY711_08755 [bacterium]|nr:hypothetical protein [bacterium]